MGEKAYFGGIFTVHCAVSYPQVITCVLYKSIRPCYTYSISSNTHNMRYTHKTSIIGAGGKVIGRMPRDTVKRIRANRSGIAVDTRKGNMFVWFIRTPFRIMSVKA